MAGISKRHVSQNVFNKDRDIYQQNSKYDGSGEVTEDSNANIYKITDATFPNTYTISLSETSTSTTICRVVGFKNGALVDVIASSTLANLPLTFSTTTDYDEIRFSIHKSVVNNLMINTGSQPLPFEPPGDTWNTTSYGIMKTATDTITPPTTIYADGTAATIGLKGNTVQNGTPTPQNPVDVVGVGERTGNLFDISVIQTEGTRSYYLTEDGTETFDSGWFITQYIPVNGDSITISGPAGINPSICAYDENKQYLRGKKYNGNNATISIQDAKFVRFSLVPTSEIHQKAMLNYGTTILPYEPYGIKTPILSAGQTTPVYLGEVQTERQIKKLVLDGTETWGSSGRIVYINNTDTERQSPLICTHFPNVQNTGMWNGNNWVFQVDISNLGMTERSDWITYLQQQYAAGTPVTVWYVLATPTTGIVNEPLQKIGSYSDSISGISIPTTDGANALSIGTTVQPSEVTAAYHGWHTGTVHERESGSWD